MTRVSYTNFRRNLAHTMDQVVESRTPITVIRRSGKGNVVVLSAEEFGGWQETIHLMSSPASARHLLTSIHDARDGRLQERDLVVAPATKEP